MVVEWSQKEREGKIDSEREGVEEERVFEGGREGERERESERE